MEICNPESITITAVADEDLRLEGDYGSVIRIQKGETTEVRMKSTTKFERLMDYFYTRHSLEEGSLAFFFTEKLRPDQCPADVCMKVADIIHIRNCLKPPKRPYEEQSSLLYYSHMKQMLEEPTMPDVCFLIGDVTIKAHKCMLASRCERFRAMFTSKMIEATSPTIRIENHTPECFRALLHYLYTDQLRDQSLEMYLELLQIGDEYLLPNITRICEARIATCVTVQNSPMVLAAADKFNARKLKEYCLGFIISNYASVVQTAEFKQHIQSPALLHDLMQAVAPYLPTRVHPMVTAVPLLQKGSFDLTRD